MSGKQYYMRNVPIRPAICNCNTGEYFLFNPQILTLEIDKRGNRRIFSPWW